MRYEYPKGWLFNVCTGVRDKCCVFLNTSPSPVLPSPQVAIWWPVKMSWFSLHPSGSVWIAKIIADEHSGYPQPLWEASPAGNQLRVSKVEEKQRERSWKGLNRELVKFQRSSTRSAVSFDLICVCGLTTNTDKEDMALHAICYNQGRGKV